eukprot:TRINITY_DN1325_c0_g1_i1.p1 TRINITY_DN1325_c0_g1~~TRINITY_DN1325_c0_g1_i1.p1  ORF type:complete len:171 (-),score=24.73 TRINITY_DN1325_c0_g1_i1:52-564(-)
MSGRGRGLRIVRAAGAPTNRRIGLSERFAQIEGQPQAQARTGVKQRQARVVTAVAPAKPSTKPGQRKAAISSKRGQETAVVARGARGGRGRGRGARGGSRIQTRAAGNQNAQGTRGGRGRGRGRGRGGRVQHKKTQAELDAELDEYQGLSKEEALRRKLDDDMDAYQAGN